MATIGLSKPYFAKYSNTGSTVTYSGGALLGKYTELSIELDDQETDNLYADNDVAETEQQFSGGTAKVTTDDLRAAVMVAVLGVKEEEITSEDITTEAPKWYVFDDDQESPYVGLGGVIMKKVDGAVTQQYLGDVVGYEAQVSELEGQVAEKEADLQAKDRELESKEATIQSQAGTIQAQAAELVEKDTAIQSQQETIEALEASGTAKQVEDKLEAAYQEGVESNG